MSGSTDASSRWTTQQQKESNSAAKPKVGVVYIVPKAVLPSPGHHRRSGG